MVFSSIFLLSSCEYTNSLYLIACSYNIICTHLHCRMCRVCILIRRPFMHFSCQIICERNCRERTKLHCRQSTVPPYAIRIATLLNRSSASFCYKFYSLCVYQLMIIIYPRKLMSIILCTLSKVHQKVRAKCLVTLRQFIKASALLMDEYIAWGE
jgi:hypothetical protein